MWPFNWWSRAKQKDTKQGMDLEREEEPQNPSEDEAEQFSTCTEGVEENEPSIVEDSVQPSMDVAEPHESPDTVQAPVVVAVNADVDPGSDAMSATAPLSDFMPVIPDAAWDIFRARPEETLGTSMQTRTVTEMADECLARMAEERPRASAQHDVGTQEEWDAALAGTPFVREGYQPAGGQELPAAGASGPAEPRDTTGNQGTQQRDTANTEFEYMLDVAPAEGATFHFSTDEVEAIYGKVDWMHLPFGETITFPSPTLIQPTIYPTPAGHNNMRSSASTGGTVTTIAGLLDTPEHNDERDGARTFGGSVTTTTAGGPTTLPHIAPARQPTIQAQSQNVSSIVDDWDIPWQRTQIAPAGLPTIQPQAQDNQRPAGSIFSLPLEPPYGVNIANWDVPWRRPQIAPAGQTTTDHPADPPQPSASVRGGLIDVGGGFKRGGTRTTRGAMRGGEYRIPAFAGGYPAVRPRASAVPGRILPIIKRTPVAGDGPIPRGLRNLAPQPATSDTARDEDSSTEETSRSGTGSRTAAGRRRSRKHKTAPSCRPKPPNNPHDYDEDSDDPDSQWPYGPPDQLGKPDRKQAIWW